MQLAASRGLTQAEVDRFLFVNTEEQSSRFKIDRDEDLREMADWLKSSGVEFVVVDVLNRLHDKQENNSDDMTRVMQRFDELAAKGHRHRSRLQHHQCSSRNGGQVANLPGAFQEAAVPSAGVRLLRVEEVGLEEQATLWVRSAQRTDDGLRGPLGCLEGPKDKSLASDLHDHHDRCERAHGASS